MSTSTLSSAVARIRKRFLIRLSEQYDKSQKLAKSWKDEGRSAEDLEELCAIAHKIAGLAKSVGFPELGKKAFQADSIIQKYQGDKQGEVLEEDVIATIDAYLESCLHALSGGR